MPELVIAQRWLYARLHGDATLAALIPGGIHDAVAPSGTVPPFLVLDDVSDVTRFALSGIHLKSDELWQVTAWAKTRERVGVIGPIMQRVYSLLHNTTGSVTGSSTGEVWDCVCMGHTNLEEPTDSTMLGMAGTYALSVKRTA
jgi:hypothetical protein